MYIQTFIKKIDGSPVFVDFEGARYIFQNNEHGHAICFVGNQGHARRLLKMGEGVYKTYDNPAMMSGPVQDMPPAHGERGAVRQLGGVHSRTEPVAHEALPDNPSVDESLMSGADGSPAQDEAKPRQVKDRPKPPPAVPSGSGQPTADAVLASTLSPTDQAAAVGGQGQESVAEVEWADDAVAAKVKEFKFLQKDPFKQFLDDNRDRIPGWPISVKTEIAKKMDNNIPGHDPGIEGFNPHDYYGS